MEADCQSWGSLIPEWNLLPNIAQATFHLWGETEVGLVGILMHQLLSAFLHLGNPLPLGTFVLNAFSHPWTCQVSYVFPPALVLLFLLMFLAEHLKGKFKILIVVAPCWMEAPWLPTIPHILKDIHDMCPIKDLKRAVFVCQVLKGLSSLHLTH